MFITNNYVIFKKKIVISTTVERKRTTEYLTNKH